MLVLSMGTLVGRLFGIASLPILTRIYAPESFGLLAVFIALVTITTLVATFYATAIPLPRRDHAALNVVVLSLLTLLVTVLALVIILSFAAPQVLGVFNATALVEWWILLVLAIAVAGIHQILVQWGTRKKAFGVISKATVYQAVLGNLTKIGLGAAGFLSLGLLIGQIVQVGSGVAGLGRLLATNAGSVGYQFRVHNIRRTARRFADFPVFRLPSQFLMAFTSHALMLFAASFFDIETAGQIALAVAVLALPMVLVGRSVGQAYYGEIAQIGRNDLPRIRQLTINVIKVLLLIAILPAIILFFGGPYIFAVVFGSEWQFAGWIASVSAPYLVIALICEPIIHVFNVLGHQKYYLWINFTRAIWTIGLFVAAEFYQFTAETTIVAYYGILCVHLLVVLQRVFRLFR